MQTEERRDVESNARLTSLAGLTLFVLLAIQGVTILRVGRLLTLHFVVGFVLVGPVLLKLGSTGYRFARYYTGDPDYGQAGPPRPLLRLAAPVLILLTLAVFGTGIALAFVGRAQQGHLLFLHKATFVLWFGVTTLHVLAYLWRACRHVGADLMGEGTPRVLARRKVRAGLLVASLVVGAAAGVLGYHLASDWRHSGRPPKMAAPLSVQ
jgi:hypothetical protein